MIKDIIEKEKSKVVAELCQKIVAKRWSEMMVAETPQEVKDLDIDNIKAGLLKETDEEKLKKLREEKEMYDRYEADLRDVETNKRAIEADVFAYDVLCNANKEITKLLK